MQQGIGRQTDPQPVVGKIEQLSQKTDVLDTMRRDEMADFHERLSTLESGNLRLSRRLTRLEDGAKGHFSDDPLSGILSPGLMWAMVALTLAPLVIEAIKQWKSSSS